MKKNFLSYQGKGKNTFTNLLKGFFPQLLNPLYIELINPLALTRLTINNLSSSYWKVSIRMLKLINLSLDMLKSTGVAHLEDKRETFKGR